jgi:hypothetical protein
MRDHPIQLGIGVPPRHVDSFELFASPFTQALTDDLVGKPVTCDGTVVGKVVSIVHDEIQIEIAKEHADFVNTKMKERNTRGN